MRAAELNLHENNDLASYEKASQPWWRFLGARGRTGRIGFLWLAWLFASKEPNSLRMTTPQKAKDCFRVQQR